MVETLVLWMKYFVLGLVQGFTEPIPISSSGHLIIVRELFHINSEGLSFEIFVNFASLLAVVIVYQKDIFRLVSHGLQYALHRNDNYKNDFRFIIHLIIATIPVGVIGFLWGDGIQTALSNINVVGATLLMTAVALFWIRSLKGTKTEHDLSIKEAIIVGLAQAVAVTPGISRSGSTIVASMILGMKRETALKFAFLLYIPVSLGTAVIEIPTMIQDPAVSKLIGSYLIAFVTSLVASYVALKWFINIMASGNLMYFVYYCLATGIFVLLFL